MGSISGGTEGLVADLAFGSQCSIQVVGGGEFLRKRMIARQNTGRKEALSHLG